MENYTDLNTWIELARLLERGKFDALFLADVVGVYDVFRGNREAALTQAAQTPVNDPMLLVPAMAAATEHLGFAFTSSILQYPPFTFARLISTLDHLTKGRVAWNIVTSYLESAGRSYGRSGLPEHDERYDMADEYCEVCYKLWESSWEDGAVVKDKQRGIYADPSKVWNVVHEGKYYKMDGCHLSEPSPQRTPVLYQAAPHPVDRPLPPATPSACLLLPRRLRLRGRPSRRPGNRPSRTDATRRIFFSLPTSKRSPAARRRKSSRSMTTTWNTRAMTDRWPCGVAGPATISASSTRTNHSNMLKQTPSARSGTTSST